MRLQIIGGGNMGSAFLLGLVNHSWAKPEDLHVVEPDAGRRLVLRSTVDKVSVGCETVVGVDAVIAVKPKDVDMVLPVLTTAEVPRVLSIAAGIRCEVLEAGLPEGTPVLRCMPNTPALVGQGAAAVAAGSSASADDLDWAAGILKAVGTVETVTEADLDAVTGLSGSGPAYLFRLAEVMISAGVKQGLTAQVAHRLTCQTLLGAATMLTSSDDHPEALRAQVTSPGGTTAAGLAVLEEADFEGLMGRVISAAVQRSEELGRIPKN